MILEISTSAGFFAWSFSLSCTYYCAQLIEGYWILLGIKFEDAHFIYQALICHIFHKIKIIKLKIINKLFDKQLYRYRKTLENHHMQHQLELNIVEDLPNRL